MITFAAPPAIRPSQANLTGISASDGVTVLLPALNQYENCLRCHGTSVGKQRLTDLRIRAHEIGFSARSAERDSGIQRDRNLEPSRHA